MEIRINGQTVDIKVDNEKTAGELLANLDMWLSDSGHCLSGLAIDGKKITASHMEAAFLSDINTITTLDVFTSPISDILIESLKKLLADINEWESLQADKRNNFINEWSKTSRFLSERMPDLYKICENVFSLGDIDAHSLRGIVMERIREIAEPSVELKTIEPLIGETCARLIDLPLDIQTAKDARAAQTMEIFTAIYEKFTRLYKQLFFQGYLEKNKDPEVTELIKAFNGFLKELLDAYQRHDTVLIGDLAEYEIAVRFKDLYSVVINNIKENIVKE